jgi:sugar/nucleoside kinase (ribokinase family)
MPVTVVGSIAFDSVKTPFGERTRMLGGAAVHFALAASFFDDVRVVGPVGEDFGEAELDVLRRRGVDVSDIEHVAGGETFFWAGEYGWDLGSRETLDTRLGVFADFEPKLSASARERCSSSRTSSPICSVPCAPSARERASPRSTR